MNQDFQPYTDLFAGNIDAHNLNAADFVANAKTHEDAHVKHHYAEIISHPYLYHSHEEAAASIQPNFLNKVVGDGEGKATEESLDAAYSLKDETLRVVDYCQENVRLIGKGGGWVPLGDGVKKQLPSDPITGAARPTTVQVDGYVETSSVGEVDLWINAFVQYFRNGFGTTMDEFVDPAMMPRSADSGENPPLDPEALGMYPSEDNNVRFVPPISMEIENPSRAGHHHISMGWSPADIQFALRVDGQILEDTITGKRNTHSRTPLGARHITTRLMNNDAVHTDDYDAGYSTPSGDSINQKMPGTRQPDVRAAGIGPEIFGTRLSTVVRAGSGSHKIEIVARRLNAAESDLDLPNDVVAVFNRQLSVVEIPRDQSSQQSLSARSLEPFSTEDPLSMNLPTKTLETFCNDIPAIAIKPNSIRQEHLTSIVQAYARKTVTADRPSFTVLPGGSGQEDNYWGWDTYETLHDMDLGGINSSDSPTLADNVGWRMLQSLKGDLMMVSNSSPEMTSSSLLLVFADVEITRIVPRGDVPMKERLLDSIANLCIGHREYNTKIGDTSKNKTWRFDRASRVHFNGHNWQGRNLNYNLSMVLSDELEAEEFDGEGDIEFGQAQWGAKDRRNIYDGAKKWNDNIHASLMFVLDGSTMFAPPSTTTGERSPAWEIGDIGVFSTSTACTRHGGSDTWQDYFWSRDTPLELETGMRFGFPRAYLIKAPMIEFGICSMSMLNLKRKKD